LWKELAMGFRGHLERTKRRGARRVSDKFHIKPPPWVAAPERRDKPAPLFLSTNSLLIKLRGIANPVGRSFINKYARMGGRPESSETEPAATGCRETDFSSNPMKMSKSIGDVRSRPMS